MKLLIAANAAVEIVVASDAIMDSNHAVRKACGRCADRVRTELPFAATAADETAVTINTITDGN